LRGVFVNTPNQGDSILRYFDVEDTLQQLKDGTTTRYHIQALRNSCRARGYQEREDFFTEVLKRWDTIRASTTEQTK